MGGTLEVFNTTFVDGPAAGRTHRMTQTPELWDVYAHRQAEGVVEIGPGRYGSHQESLWERFDYRRIELTPYSAVYALAETPACMIGRVDYGGFYVGGEFDHVDNCKDRAHAHFWFPENWAGGRAPGRWIHRDRSEDRQVAQERFDRGEARTNDAQFIGDSIGVELWVPECCVFPPGGALWWMSAADPGTASACIAWWVKAEAELKAERDAILDARDALEDLRFAVRAGALPG